jgi:adenine-specific DNA-methyltransferase
MDKMKFETPNLTAENLKKLAELFPGVVTEGKVNVDLLRSYVGEEIFKDESYEFTWVGKRAAIAEAGRPIRKTLRPCPEESRDWDNTENLYIEGDNLDVLKLLQESYLGKVKMIYIDPPYNTGNDFIYRDDFAQSREEYDEEAGVFDDDGDRLFRNTESNGRFHSDWCSMIYPRLVLARNLLSAEGVIFISIDDNEVAQLRELCDEVFGESNFVDCITWNTRVPKNDNKGLGNIHQYILVYVKQSQYNRQFMMMKDGLDEVFELCEKLKRQGTPIPQAEEELKKLYNKKGYDRGITLYNALDDNYQPWGKINMSWPNSDTFGPNYDVLHPQTKKPTKKPDRGWRWNRETFDSHLDYEHIVKRHDGSFVCGDIWFAKDENTQPSSIKYLCDVGKMLLRTIISLKSDGGVELESIFEGKSYFSNPKPVSLMRLLIGSLEEKDGIILDFFSGSATTAHAVMQLNAEDGGKRKYIMVQLPEVCAEGTEAAKAGYKNICEIGKERIRRAGDKIKADAGLTTQNLDIGFRVLKLDDTNMNEVYYAAGDYTQDMLSLMESNIKPDRNDMDLLFGCLLDWGLPLSMPHTHEKIDGFTVHTYNDGDLIACFEEHISEKAIREIANRKPLRAVFRDSSFSSSPEKINVFEIFKLLAPNTSVKVI